MKKIKIAVVGSGISGLSSAYYLSKEYDVDLFEKNSYFGGHTNTQKVNINKEQIFVDTGFIVFNTINYPNLCKLFEQLKIKSYDSDMSFSVSNLIENLEYSGTNLLSLFSQKKNFFNFNFLRMLIEIIKFNNSAEKDKKKYKDLTIEEYLKRKNYSDYYKYHHIYPMAASIWSSKIDDIKNYPFENFVNFFANHGLLKIFNRPRWRTVSGGSKSYVEKILKSKKIKSYKNCNIKFLGKERKKIFLEVSKKKKIYDHLILAVHGDQVNRFFNYKNKEKNIFKNIKYTRNEVYLHVDEKLMPRNRKCWSSWNYLEDSKKNNINVTYWMNKLQNLKTESNIFVSLNPSVLPEKKKIFTKHIYDHPLFDFNTFEKQKLIKSIQGRNNIWYCGAYLGYGFHEDGIKSAIDVVRLIKKKMKKINNVNETLFQGIVFHKRYKPFEHSFNYKFCYFWFSIYFKKKFKFFKKNELALFSFYDKDHGEVNTKNDNFLNYLENKFKNEGENSISDIKVFCLPRVLGYVFNPISVFVCFGKNNKVNAIIYEVSNTFNERHSYYYKIKKNIPIKKRFHVSPFFNIKGNYIITFNIDSNFVNFQINYNVKGQKIFEASFRGRSIKMNDKELLRVFFKNFFQNFKATLAIHIQALKLFFKGAKYISKPKKPKNFFSGS